MLIATPNLCLDITIRLPRLVPGSVARASSTRTDAGGKGVNVARAAQRLGLSPVVAGFLPGTDGARLSDLLDAEGITLHQVDVAGVLRVASILVEDDGRVSVVNGRGPEVSPLQWERFCALIAADLPGSGALVCSGSLPPGTPVDGYGQLVELAHRAGVPAIVDASPSVLGATLAHAPDLVSPNLSEAEGLLLGRTDEQVDEVGPDVADRAVEAARALHVAGAVRAVVTAGSAGAALCTAAGLWWLPAEPVELVNPIGAGDCFAAGAGLAMIAGAADLDIVRRGMAVASASCETPTAGLVDPARAQQLFQAISARLVQPTGSAR